MSEAEQSGAGRPAQPVFGYWHVYTDQNGVSRQTRCSIAGFALKGMSGAAPQWQKDLVSAKTTVNLSILPAGWIGDWHENPAPQGILPLAGKWFVETMDGTRVEMGPGEASFGDDLGTKPDPQGRKGHRSGVVGDEAAVLMLVQLPRDFSQPRPCIFE